MAQELRLRPLGPEDEAAFLRAHAEMREVDDFPFGLNYDEGMPWEDYIDRHHNFRRGIGLPEGLVPAAFLVADVGGQIVGRVSVRHELNDWLDRNGGHIGYGVLPAFRRRGYATAILHQSLVIAHSVGIQRALLFCDHDNEGSATVIERCGGEFESMVESDEGTLMRRYWIP